VCGRFVRDGTGFRCKRALVAQKSRTNGDSVRVVNVGASIGTKACACIVPISELRRLPNEPKICIPSILLTRLGEESTMCLD
jgi:hypothetical protein